MNSAAAGRTVWSPQMHKYFMSLMLDQVKKGNMLDDYLFSNEAWDYMSSLFNAKFKFHYDIDFLKNKHKTLRDLYRSVKNILNWTGFTWDVNRHMVIADNDYLWDDYIKIWSHARSLRGKSFPYYSTLCLIFGDRIIEQKGDIVPESFSHTHEGEINPTVQPVSIPEGDSEGLDGFAINEQYEICVSHTADDTVTNTADDTLPTTPGVNEPSQTTPIRTRTSWHPPMDRCFIDLMLDQVRRGNFIEGVFRKHAWTKMISAFNAKFGFSYNVDVLKNRFKTLKRQYNGVRELLQYNGFVWDDARQMVTADDHVWQEYSKAHTVPKSIQFMTHPFPYYKDLCLICKESCLNETGSFSLQNLDTENNIPEFKSNGTANNLQSQGSTSSSSQDETLLSNLKNKRQPENETYRLLPKKPRDEQSMANALSKITTEVSSLKEQSSALSKSATEVSFIAEKNKDNVISIENVIVAVQALPDMDEELILDACDLLEDEGKARTFMALDIKLRRKWLVRKLRPQA